MSDLNLSCARDFLNLSSIVTSLVYRLKKIVGSNNFSEQFVRISSHYKKIGYKINELNRLHAWWST